MKFTRDLGKVSLKEKLPNVPDAAVDFVEKCLGFDFNSRLDSDELLNHPFLADVR